MARRAPKREVPRPDPQVPQWWYPDEQVVLPDPTQPPPGWPEPAPSAPDYLEPTKWPSGTVAAPLVPAAEPALVADPEPHGDTDASADIEGRAVGNDPAVTQLAVQYAIDHLSWDEVAPRRRATSPASYQADSATPMSGWSGHGQQRATFAVGGRVRIDDADHDVMWVDVRVLVTTDRHTDSSSPQTSAPNADPPAGTAGNTPIPSPAPVPASPGWPDSDWLGLDVPVRRTHAGRLVIDPDREPIALDLADLTAQGA
jgi:hypothetical protein